LCAAPGIRGVRYVGFVEGDEFGADEITRTKTINITYHISHTFLDIERMLGK
jgi:hypothetical protein